MLSICGASVRPPAMDLRDNRRQPTLGTRPPEVQVLSTSKQPTQPVSRKDRRAAARSERSDDVRGGRKAKGPSRGGPSSLVSTRSMTLAAIVVGVVIVAVVAIGQLGNRASGTFTDPRIAYPAGVIHDNTLGSADAPVTLEVYGDLQCPVCGRYSLDVEPALVARYVVPGKVRIVHHDFALLGRPSRTDPNNESRIAASGAVCAVPQGRYWDFVHWMYANQSGENAGGFTRERTTAIATAAGLDGPALAACLDQPATTGAVDATTEKVIGMGINSTPTFYLNGMMAAVGFKTVDQMSALIDAVLAAPSGSPVASGGASPAASPSLNP